MSNDKQTLKESRLQEILEENRMLKEVLKRDSDQRVMVRFSGLGPDIVVKIGNDKSFVLSNQRGHGFVNMPMEEYLDLRHRSPYFDLGYLYTDEDLESSDNPNFIVDIEAWFEERTERQILKDLDHITSPGTLNALYHFTEGRAGGKVLAMRSKVSQRLNDVLGIVMQEDTEE